MSDEMFQGVKIPPEQYAQRIGAYRLPRYSELPDLELYMDQLITYVSGATALLETSVDKPLTASMVNNYVKQGVMPRPQNKRYNRAHVAYLLAICILKRAYSLADIERLVELQTCSAPLDRTYDFFCESFETGLRMLFERAAGDRAPAERVLTATAGDGGTGPKRVALAAAASTAAKVYVDVELDWMQQSAQEGAAR